MERVGGDSEQGFSSDSNSDGSWPRSVGAVAVLAVVDWDARGRVAMSPCGWRCDCGCAAVVVEDAPLDTEAVGVLSALQRPGGRGRGRGVIVQA